MAKVGASLSLTLRLRPDSNEYIRVQADISDVDTDLDLATQLPAVKKTLHKTLAVAEKVIDEKLVEMIAREVLKTDPDE